MSFPIAVLLLAGIWGIGYEITTRLFARAPLTSYDSVPVSACFGVGVVVVLGFAASVIGVSLGNFSIALTLAGALWIALSIWRVISGRTAVRVPEPRWPWILAGACAALGASFTNHMLYAADMNIRRDQIQMLLALDRLTLPTAFAGSSTGQYDGLIMLRALVERASGLDTSETARVISFAVGALLALAIFGVSRRIYPGVLVACIAVVLYFALGGDAARFRTLAEPRAVASLFLFVGFGLAYDWLVRTAAPRRHLLVGCAVATTGGLVHNLYFVLWLGLLAVWALPFFVSGDRRRALTLCATALVFLALASPYVLLKRQNVVIESADLALAGAQAPSRDFASPTPFGIPQATAALRSEPPVPGPLLLEPSPSAVAGTSPIPTDSAPTTGSSASPTAQPTASARSTTTAQSGVSSSPEAVPVPSDAIGRTFIDAVDSAIQRVMADLSARIGADYLIIGTLQIVAWDPRHYILSPLQLFGTTGFARLPYGVWDQRTSSVLLLILASVALRRRARRPADLFLIGTAFVPLVLYLNPLFLPVIANQIGLARTQYLGFSLSFFLIAALLVTLATGLRRGHKSRHRWALLGALLVLSPVVASNVFWYQAVAQVEDSSVPFVERAARAIAPYEGRGDRVYTQPEIANVVASTTGLAVATWPDQVNEPATTSQDPVLNGTPPELAARALRSFDVKFVIVDTSLTGWPAWRYSKLQERPNCFHPLMNQGGVLVYLVSRCGD